MENPHESHSQAADISMLGAWNDPALYHGFFDRTGGVSVGTYTTLNLGTRVGDDERAVEENWRRARKLARLETFARLVQVHGSEIRHVTQANVAERPEADGMVTREPEVGLAVLTADCVPVLLADSQAGVVAALHAGWRGTIAGIAERGVEAMLKLGASTSNIRAALGPSIGQCCFEVDLELAERFGREIPGSEAHTRSGRVGKAYLDLRGIVRNQLVRVGLDSGNVSSVGPCTRCASERYFSRRAAGGVITGLQMSFVGLAP